MGFVCKLEDDLIDPDKWEDLYDKMPPECQAIVDHPEEQGGPTGIGRNEKLGWFIMCSGQGPFPHWSEKQEEKNG
jgi:hypothetical protein